MGRKLTLIILTIACLDFPLHAAENYTLYFSRHAEKIHGTGRDPELSVKGKERARRLSQFLADKNIKAVYATAYKRTQNTAKPTAEMIGQAVLPYDPRDLSTFIELLRQRQQNALILGHSNTTPEAVRLAGGEAPDLDESDYGSLFEVLIGPSTSRTIVHQIAP